MMFAQTFGQCSWNDDEWHVVLDVPTQSPHLVATHCTATPDGYQPATFRWRALARELPQDARICRSCRVVFLREVAIPLLRHYFPVSLQRNAALVAAEELLAQSVDGNR